MKILADQRHVQFFGRNMRMRIYRNRRPMTSCGVMDDIRCNVSDRNSAFYQTIIFLITLLNICSQTPQYLVLLAKRLILRTATSETRPSPPDYQTITRTTPTTRTKVITIPSSVNIPKCQPSLTSHHSHPSRSQHTTFPRTPSSPTQPPTTTPS